MNSPSILPSVVKNLLKVIQSVAPEACVSGGYLRDTLSLVQPKDIDIFCNHLSTDQYALLAHLYPAMRPEVAANAAEYVFGGVEREVDAVWDLGVSANGCPLQLIELSPNIPAGESYKRNDFGICQLKDDGVHLTMTKAALKDLGNRTFTLVECVNKDEHARSMKRWARLSGKYPDHWLVDEAFNQVFPL